MHWGEVLAIIGSNIALISWLRSDMKSFESKIEADMKSFENKIESKVDSIKEQIQQESRDFHGRLCAIEERNKK